MEERGARGRALRWAGLAAGAALVVAGLVGTLLVASAVTVPKNNQEEFGQHEARARGVLGESPESVDVLFLGDSEAYSSFSPLQLWHERGIRSYVCATPGQKLCVTRELLGAALREQSPVVVALETNCLFTTFSAEDAMFSVARSLLPVLEYHDRWKSLRIEDFLEPVRATWTDELKGFRSSTEVRAADASGHMAPDRTVTRLAPRNRIYVEDIARLCREHGAELVLVSTPSTKNWSSARHNGVSELASGLGVGYVDLNAGPDAVAIDWAHDTRDAGDHLNLFGAQKVTAAVGAILAERHGVPDRRAERGREAWNEAYERYVARNPGAGAN